MVVRPSLEKTSAPENYAARETALPQDVIVSFFFA